MRISELVIKSIKPKQPLNPAQARVYGLQQNVKRSREQLATERERQHQQRENERKRKEQLRRSKPA